MNAYRNLFAASALLVACAVSLPADTTINNTNKYAYGANIGWLNFQGDTHHGAAIGQYFCTGLVWSANCGWISLGNGPTNGFQYSNTSADDFGVNHNAQGVLRGLAYGANIGWIRFEKKGIPRVDLVSGRLSGFAYGANIGWISLSNQFAFVKTDALDPGPDADADGIPDAWEMVQVGNLDALGGGTNDLDADGVADHLEYVADSDPDDPNDFLRITDLDLTEPATTSTVSWASEATRLYRIEQALKLSNATQWADSGLGILPPDAGGQTTRAFADAASTTRYIRVQALLPPAP